MSLVWVLFIEFRFAVHIFQWAGHVLLEPVRMRNETNIGMRWPMDIMWLIDLCVSLIDWQEEDNVVFLSTLTRSQVAAVERRVTSLQQTLLRRRNRQHVPDVRDIFRPPEKVRGCTWKGYCHVFTQKYAELLTPGYTFLTMHVSIFNVQTKFPLVRL